MKFILAFFCLVFSSTAIAKIPVTISTKPDTTELTTERVLRAEAQVDNAFLVKVLLDQKFYLVGVEVKDKKIQFDHLQVDLLVSERRFFFPSMNPLDSVYCVARTNPQISTAGGILAISNHLTEGFEKVLNQELPSLEKRIKALSFSVKEEDLSSLNLVFEEWIQELRKQFEKKIASRAREAELKYYQSLAKQKSCREVALHFEKLKRADKAVSFIDNETESEPDVKAIAKRQLGIPTVRLSIDFDSTSYNGEFAFDLSSDRSIVSNHWAERQGVPSSNLYQKDLAEIFHYFKGRKVGKQLFFENAEINSLPIPIDEFWRTDGLLFEPPKAARECCDGFLGKDFFKHFVFEWENETYPHVNLYQNDRFLPKAGAQEIDVAFDSTGRLTSFCEIGKNPVKVVFNLLRTPEFVAKPTALKKQTLTCSGVTLIANEDLPVFKKPFEELELGMGFLDRTSFALSTAYGKMWFESDVSKVKPLVNVSGLKLEFKFDSKGRELVVGKIDRKKEELKKTSLKVGDQIHLINGVKADKLDEVLLLRYLSGKDFPDLKISFQKPGSEKTPEELSIKLR